ncbi:MAG: hypothetical protein AB2L20_15860 [Mangrovibacterium sp.]
MNNQLVMTRKASDNEYFHKDFHISLNILLKYIYENFGKYALINYLKQYAEAYYKPLNQQLKTGGIEILKDYFTDIYNKEKWSVRIRLGKDYVEIEQDACPGITHIRAKGQKPCPHYEETYHTVYRTLCMNTPFEYVLEYFDEETGACKQRFTRK